MSVASAIVSGSRFKIQQVNARCSAAANSRTYPKPKGTENARLGRGARSASWHFQLYYHRTACVRWDEGNVGAGPTSRSSRVLQSGLDGSTPVTIEPTIPWKRDNKNRFQYIMYCTKGLSPVWRYLSGILHESIIDDDCVKISISKHLRNCTDERAIWCVVCSPGENIWAFDQHWLALKVSLVIIGGS